MELGISWCEGPYAYVSADVPKYKNVLLKLRAEYPEDVTFIAGNEDNPVESLRDNDGCLYARVPISWIRIKPPVRREFSEEQKAELRERMMRMRQAKEEKAARETEENL